MSLCPTSNFRLLEHWYTCHESQSMKIPVFMGSLGIVRKLHQATNNKVKNKTETFDKRKIYTPEKITNDKVLAKKNQM